MHTSPTAEPNQTPHQPIQLIIPDSTRIQAALKLASAIEKLAEVIAGDTTHVTIKDCSFTSTGGGAGVEIQRPS